MLPDYLRSGLAVVFVGTSVSFTSAERGHYYSNPSNKFWSLLSATGLVGEETLGPQDDVRLNSLGVGLTDVVKLRAESSDGRLKADDFDVPGFLAKVNLYRPRVVAFNGRMAASVVARHLGNPTPNKAASWQIGTTRVYRLPSSSGAATIRVDAKRGSWSEFGAWVGAMS
jgi:double-stranded uracil-DNA glycosylase